MAPVQVALIVLFVGRTLACTSTTFAQSQPRSLTWTSLPTTTDAWQHLIPFLFNPPTFLDRWRLADFSLISANLTLPCSVVPQQQSPHQPPVQWPDIFVVPEAWIEFLPAFEAGARSDRSNSRRSMCELIPASNVSVDEVPGCQDWSKIEAWRRLRIFYDIQSPVSANVGAEVKRQCSSAFGRLNATWTVPVSSMLRRWMADRSPWTRSKAVMPIVMVSKVPVPQVRWPTVQAELHLIYWMDTRCIIPWLRNESDGDGQQVSTTFNSTIAPDSFNRLINVRGAERTLCRFHDRCLVCCGLYCDFEELTCQWHWSARFVRISAAAINASIFSGRDPTMISGPLDDADGRTDGHFLYVKGGSDNGTQIELSSPWYQEAGPVCKLSVALHMNNMEDGNLKIVVETRNHTWVIVETLGNSLREWRTLTHSVGRINQPFRLKLEFTEGKKIPSHAAVDNIRLLSCLTEIAPGNGSCNDSARHTFRCNGGHCLPRDQVCDLSKDCPGGEDEEQDCDQVIEGTRCDFEHGWCGWTDVLRDGIHWRRHNGSTPTPQTGPSHDNTYKNSTGMYVYVDMSETKEMGSAAVLQSIRFPPPPKYHSNPSSPFYNSCRIRFFYHMHGPHIGELVARVVEEDRRNGGGNKSTDIWRQSRAGGDIWHRAAVPLPHIKKWYVIQFIAKRGIRFRGDIGIDDVSLSPECSGIGVPKNETVGWPPAHYDEPNFIRYTLTTCGARGRLGPNQTQCNEAYQNTPTKVDVLNHTWSGVQVWTVPSDGLYTIIAKGASGGTAAGNNGAVGHGARIRAVFFLQAGTRIHFLIGQEGGTESIKEPMNRSGNESSTNGDSRRSSLGKMRGLNSANGGRSSGGGGGGATFVFQMDGQGQLVPLVVASGGGGMAANARFPLFMVDTTLVHAKGLDNFLPRLGVSGIGTSKGAGGGGGWNGSAVTEAFGAPLAAGGMGGNSCNPVADNPTVGGFGGGGGGCTNGEGGGGGGFNGGNAVTNSSGEGGLSFVSSAAIEWLSESERANHAGPGSVDIMPAISEGCGCELFCVVLDPSLEERQCVCGVFGSDEWLAEDNVTKCGGAMADPGWFGSSHMVGVITAVVIVIVLSCIVCFCMYTRYQRQQLAALRRKAMAGPELQLSRLRGPSSSMVSEYNPNYEFGSGPCSVQGLKEIPRENLRLVRALGQGAFGEVYQGYLRHVAGDSVEMPVAVKVLQQSVQTAQTLPELSSNQTEMDFLMEAIIMSKFHHANIVHFIGICFDKHPRFIVLELLAGGDLKTFLRESRPKADRPSALTMKDLLKCALDVAKGCRYLEENHFIHRDIAARNCLLTTKGPGRVVKIADFGMSRDIYRADYYRKGGKAMLPVKWMPPEAFLEGVFTSKTDVWSFGVLLWEVMSLGYMPYPGRGNQEVMQLVTSGGRLEAPPGCPGPVYRVMVQCWHTSPEERPTFATVLERIGYCMQDPDVLAMPIPVFQRPLSQERDATVVRPPPGAEATECLRVLRPRNSTGNLVVGTTIDSVVSGVGPAEYLIPLANSRVSTGDLRSTSAVSSTSLRDTGPESCGYWETSFTREGVKAIARGEPVPADGDHATSGSAGNLSLGDLRSRRRSRSYATVSAFEAPSLSQSQSTQPLLDTPPDSPPAGATSGAEGVQLDASSLCRQSYANVRISNGPVRAGSTKSERSVKNEIAC